MDWWSYILIFLAGMLVLFIILFRLRIIFPSIPKLVLHQKEGTFNWKIKQRMKNDNQDLFSQLTDKYEVREYIKTHSQTIKLAQLLYVSDNPETIPFNKLPSRYVIKLTHGQAMNIIMKDGVDLVSKKRLTPNQIIKKCKRWAKKTYGKVPFFNQPHYWKITPRVIIEEFLEAEDGEVPKDYKFFTFHGKVGFIKVDSDRFGVHKASYYDPQWKKLEMMYGYKDTGVIEPIPSNFTKMIQIAEELGKDIDFVRVDLYKIGEEAYFGEMTFTPGAGAEKMRPITFDEYFGSLW